MRPRWILFACIASSLAVTPRRSVAQHRAPRHGAAATPASSAPPTTPPSTTPAANVATAPVANPAEVQARAHFERGLALFQTQDFNGALAEFQAAYDLSHRATVLYNLGVTHQALHHYPEAARSIEQFLREATVTPERRAQVEAGLAEIHEFIAHVTLVVPDGATVTIDGESAGTAPFTSPIAVGTGRHVVSAHLDGHHDAQETLLIAGGQSREVRLELRAEAPSASTESTSLAVHAPTGASIELDGHPIAVDQAVAVTPGDHTLRATAAGLAPYEGHVSVALNQHRSATIHFASNRMSPAPFAVFGVATVGSAIAMSVLGAMTNATHAHFAMLTQEDPQAQALSNTGATQRTLTNVFVATTAVFGVATVITGVLFFRSAGATSGIDVAFAPRLEGGAEGSVRVRF